MANLFGRNCGPQIYNEPTGSGNCDCERGILFFRGENPPPQAIEGDIWYDTTSGIAFQRVSTSGGNLTWAETSGVDLESLDDGLQNG